MSDFESIRIKSEDGVVNFTTEDKFISYTSQAIKDFLSEHGVNFRRSSITSDDLESTARDLLANLDDYLEEDENGMYLSDSSFKDMIEEICDENYEDEYSYDDEDEYEEDEYDEDVSSFVNKRNNYDGYDDIDY